MTNADRDITIYTATDRAACVRRGDAVEAGILGVSDILTKDEAFDLPWSVKPIWVKRKCRQLGDRKLEYFCYMLFRCGRMIYAGRSHNVRARIGSHTHGKLDHTARKEFDSMSYIALNSDASMIWWESVLIDIFRPEWNNKWGDVMIQRPVVLDAFQTLVAEIPDGTYKDLLSGLASGSGAAAA